METKLPNSNYPFLPAHTESGKHISSRDWTDTIIGEPANWPAVLNTHLTTILYAPLPMFLWWGAEAVQFQNDAALALMSDAPSQAPGEILDLYWPRQRKEMRVHIAEVMETGKALRSSEVLIPVIKNGYPEDSYYTFNYSPVADETGAIKAVLAICTEDATRFLSSGNTTGEHETAFRESLLHAPVGITIVRGAEFIVETANNTYLQLIGRTKETFIGRSLFESLPEVTQLIKPIFESVVKTGQAYKGEEFEITLHRYGKEEKTWFNFVYHPLRTENHIVDGIIVIANEVTKLVLAKHALQESELRFRSLIAQSPIAMCIFRGKDLVIELANDTMVKTLWRRETAAIQDKKLLDVFPELREQKFEELLMNVLATGQSHKEFETPALVNTPDGDQLYYLDFEYAPLFETDGTVSGIMAQVYNVTEKVAARLKSKEAAERLELVLNASELGTWELSLPDKEFTFSKKFLEIFHFGEDQQPTHEEVVKRIHPGDLAERAAAFESAYASGTLFYNCRLLTGEEQVRWIEVKGKVFYDAQQQPVKLIGTIRDFTEERKAQQRITESELRFRTVADTAPVMIWMSTPDKARSFFNKAWLMFRGRTSREEAGMAWMEAIHPDDAPHCLEIYTKNFDARKEYHMEYRLLRYDGEYRWISENGVPRFGTDGSFEGYIGASKDIHERIVFEEKIQESETRLRIAALSGELGTWDYSPITHTLIWDNASKELFGFESAETITLEKFYEKLHPEDAVVTAKQMADALTPGLSDNFDMEYRISLTAGRYERWIHAKGKALFDKNGQPNRFSGTVLDVTDKKIALDELKLNEQRYRFLADAMPQFVWTSGADGVLNYFNQSVYDYSGLTQEQSLNGGWLDIVHPDDRAENVRLWSESILTGKPFLYEHRFRRADGVYKWQLSRAIPQQDSDGHIRMWVGTSTDIDEMKKHELQKNDFIKMANHELKTPVTTIKGYVQLLLKTHGSSEDALLSNSLVTVDKQVSKLTNLISDLLDVTKIETGRLPLNKEAFEVADLVNDTVKDMQAAAQSHAIELTIHAGARVLADKERISQVLLNLFTNAYKYSPKADKVVVEVNSKDGEVIVSVQDFGIGIAESDHQKIFERFYRVEGKDEKTFPGFGIGLFIVNEIMQLHQGRLWVESEKDKGATFYFSLPIFAG